MPRRRVTVIALAAALACLLPACSSSKYEFASNKAEGVYLKVPDRWHDFDQDQLRPLYAEPGEEASPEAYEILKQVVVWERGWDSARQKDINNFVLGQANAPVARASVRYLTRDQQVAISTETLRNLVIASYREDVENFKELLRNPGTSDLVSADFVPLVDEELRPGETSNVRAGFSGVRQVFQARTPDGDLYMIGFLGVMDDARSRIYTLTVHCNRACWVMNESAIQKVLDSFTVRKI